MLVQDNPGIIKEEFKGYGFTEKSLQPNYIRECKAQGFINELDGRFLH